MSFQITEENLFQLLDISGRLEPAVAKAWQIAASHPAALYYFMKVLVDFNFYAAPSATILAANLKLSHKTGLCLDPAASFEDLENGAADHSGEVAAYIFAALPDEYGSGNDPDHRTLALALLSVIADYADISDVDCNFVIPDWQRTITTRVQSLYQGNPQEKASLVRAIGAHWASERLADKEYAIGDKIVRHDMKNMGLDKFLREKYLKINIVGDERYEMKFGKWIIDPWAWVKAHGVNDAEALEMEHFKNAQHAVNLMLQYPGSESSEQIWAWITEGALGFANLQNDFFVNIAKECQSIIDATAEDS